MSRLLISTLVCAFIVVSATMTACGRLGFEPRQNGSADATADGATLDAAADPLAPLARWRINEASSGTDTPSILDDTPNPVNLTVVYTDGSPSWEEASGGRLLLFTPSATTDSGGAQAIASGTKLDQLDGTTTATVETKHEWIACTDTDPRVIEIADGTDPGNSWLSVRENRNRETFAVRFAGNPSWTTLGYDVGGNTCLTGVHVVHWVLDTTAAQGPDRVRAYVDGSRVTVVITSGSGPTIGQPLDLGTGERRVSISRPHNGERKHDGRVWYAAIYSRVLDEAEIEDHARRLLANDDDELLD